MRRKLGLKGQRFGRLTVIKNTGKRGKYAVWLCRCDCGNLTEVLGHHLKSSHTRSCGCLQREALDKGRQKHGGSNSRLYNIWTNMKQRCHNRKASNYKYYGEKGIKVCPEWKNSYESFRDWALAYGYANNLTIHRIMATLGYSPENCCWITQGYNSKRSQERKKFLAEARGQAI